MKIRLFTIPNLLTLSNLLCGCGALVAVLTQGNMVRAFWLVVSAAVFDFLDGFSARLFRSYSPVGAQLDSLADLVSFGVVPAAALFVMYNGAVGDSSTLPESYVMFALALFSALRLARFNVDTRQNEEFIGLPTPACALLVMSLAWLTARETISISPAFLLADTVVLCWLLVSPLRMFSLKFRDFRWHNNRLRITFLVVSAVALVLLRVGAVPLIVIGYVLLSVPMNFGRASAE